MGNTPNLGLKKLVTNRDTTHFDHDLYYQDNFEKIDTAMGEPPENLDTIAKTIIPAINEVNEQLPLKVDKVDGKGLSTEDYTLIEKNKVANVPENTTQELSQVNAQLADIENETLDISKNLRDLDTGKNYRVIMEVFQGEPRLKIEEVI